MDFSSAVKEILAGKTMARGRKFRYPEAHFLNPSGERDHAGILKRDAHGAVSRFEPDLADITADDWHEFVPEPKDETQHYDTARETRIFNGQTKPATTKGKAFK